MRSDRRFFCFNRAVAAIGVCLLLLAGCVPRPAAPPPLPRATAAELLKRLAADGQAFRSLKGMARVKISTGTRSFSADQILLAKKPDRLRSEALSFFGQPVFLVATDGTELTVLSPTEGKFYRGKATSANLQRILRVPLRPTDLVHILLYQVPVVAHTRQSLASAEKGGYRLSLVEEGRRRQTLVFDADLRLVEAGYWHDAKLALRVTYGKFTDEKGHPFPQAICLQVPSVKAEASVVFSDVRTNVTIPEGRFTLTPPAGVEVLPIP